MPQYLQRLLPTGQTPHHADRSYGHIECVGHGPHDRFGGRPIDCSLTDANNEITVVCATNTGVFASRVNVNV